MKINKIFLDGVVSTIRSLHFIIMNTNDEEIQKKCKETILVLHKKSLIPITDYTCSLSKNSD